MISISSKKGFSLIELMIVLAIVAILLRIAYPSYIQYIYQANRADATSTITQIQLAEETYRTNNTTYGTLAQVWGGVTTSPLGYYTLAITGITATGYTVTATAVGNQANDNHGGTVCTPMQVVVNDLTTTQTPAVCW